eukprot:7941793-Alexandrium_andersonii.AAC.1
MPTKAQHVSCPAPYPLESGRPRPPHSHPARNSLPCFNRSCAGSPEPSATEHVEPPTCAAAPLAMSSRNV